TLPCTTLFRSLSATTDRLPAGVSRPGHGLLQRCAGLGEVDPGGAVTHNRQRRPRCTVAAIPNGGSVRSLCRQAPRKTTGATACPENPSAQPSPGSPPRAELVLSKTRLLDSGCQRGSAGSRHEVETVGRPEGEWHEQIRSCARRFLPVAGLRSELSEWNRRCGADLPQNGRIRPAALSIRVPQASRPTTVGIAILSEVTSAFGS